MTEEEEVIQKIVDRYDGQVGMLIPMMQDLQAEHGYLPAEQLRRLSTRLEVPLSRTFAVATFYAAFRLAPKGAHEVTLCVGTVCYLKGAGQISETICREFQVEPGGTTSDRLFSFQPVNCVGACALAPVMVVDGKYHDGVTPDSAVKILRGLTPAPGAEPQAVPLQGGDGAEPLPVPQRGQITRAEREAVPLRGEAVAEAEVKK